MPLILGLLFFTGCSGRKTDTGTLVIGISSSLNLGTNNPVVIQRNSNVWETLTVLDDSLIARPCLAESWTVSDDGRIWTLVLKKGVRFHDGVQLTTDLVVRNIMRLKNHPELDYYSVYTALDTVIVKDDTTIELDFDRPSIDFPNKAGHYFAGIFSPSAIGDDGKLIDPVGSGPYRFIETAIGKYDLVKAFADYYGGKPHFETVEFRIIPDPVVRIMSLIRGDIDMIAHHGGVPAPHLSLVRNKPGIVLDSLDVAITHYLLFNCARPPFSDRTARDTFDRLLNRDELVTLILEGAGVPAHDFFIERAAVWDRRRFPTHPDTTGGPTSAGMDSLRAHAPLTLLLNQSDMNSWGYRRAADYLVDYFGRLGIQFSTTVLEGGAWQKATGEGDFDITLYPLSMPTGTPELFIRRLAYSEGMRVRSIGNTTHFSSPDFDARFMAALGATSAEEHTRAYNALLDTLAYEKPVVPLYHDRYYFAYREGLTGVNLDPFLKPDLAAIGETGK